MRNKIASYIYEHKRPYVEKFSLALACLCFFATIVVIIIALSSNKNICQKVLCEVINATAKQYVNDYCIVYLEYQYENITFWDMQTDMTCGITNTIPFEIDCYYKSSTNQIFSYFQIIGGPYFDKCQTSYFSLVLIPFIVIVILCIVICCLLILLLSFNPEKIFIDSIIDPDLKTTKA